jgi:hypothetical protein
MTEPPSHKPQTAKFLFQSSLAAVVVVLALLYVAPRWQGPLSPLKKLDPPEPAAEQTGGWATGLRAPEKAKLKLAQPAGAIAVVPEPPPPPVRAGAPNLPDAEILPEVESEKAVPNARLKRVRRPGTNYFQRELPPEKKGPPKDPKRAEAGSAAAVEAAEPKEKMLKPVIMERPGIEPGSAALAREKPPAEEGSEGLDPRKLILGVAGFFLVVFFFLARALRRGPGGDGYSLD